MRSSIQRHEQHRHNAWACCPHVGPCLSPNVHQDGAVSLQCAHADNVMHNTSRYFLPHTSAQQLHVAGATRRKGSLQKPRTRRAGKQILTQVFLVGGSQTHLSLLCCTSVARRQHWISATLPSQLRCQVSKLVRASSAELPHTPGRSKAWASPWASLMRLAFQH